MYKKICAVFIIFLLFLLFLLPVNADDGSTSAPSPTLPAVTTNQSVKAGSQPDLRDLRDGLYLVLRTDRDRDKLLPVSDNERILVNDFHFLEPAEREPAVYVVLAAKPFVPFDLAAGPTEGKEEGTGKPRLQLQLDESQKSVLADFTRANLGHSVAIVIGGEIVTIHKVKSVITGGKLQIVRCTKNGCETLFTRLLKERQAASDESKESGPVKVLTWNIQVGSDDKLKGNDWRRRKSSLLHSLRAADPDVLCTQEGRLPQLEYLDAHLSGYGRVGVGRDDGKNAGEFCAIYFKKDRLRVLKSGTFWLSDTPGTAQTTWDSPYKRICTHALFKDRINGTEFVVLSTHFPLKEPARLKSAILIAKKIKSLYEGYPTMLCGDFNCEPGSKVWNEFKTVFLEPVDIRKAKTYHEGDRAVSCIDAIFKDEDTRVVEVRVLKDKNDGVYPSDHFGLLVKAFIPEINRSR